MNWFKYWARNWERWCGGLIGLAIVAGLWLHPMIGALFALAAVNFAIGGWACTAVLNHEERLKHMEDSEYIEFKPEDFDV